MVVMSIVQKTVLDTSRMTIILHDNMKCGLCHSKTIPFLDLGQQPLANKYPKKEDFATEDFFPMIVHFCPECKNVQLGTIISRERMFEDYYYLSSVNQGLVRHFEELAQKQKGAHFVVDLGSNDGIFLKPLKQMGIKAIGVEPSINVSKIANDNGLETINSFFDAAAVKKKLEVYKKSGLLVAGYGAPARVATITNYGTIGPSLIEFIVDDSPLKQDRYSPGMHIPIAPKTFLDAT